MNENIEFHSLVLLSPLNLHIISITFHNHSICLRCACSASHTQLLVTWKKRTQFAKKIPRLICITSLQWCTHVPFPYSKEPSETHNAHPSWCAPPFILVMLILFTGKIFFCVLDVAIGFLYFELSNSERINCTTAYHVVNSFWFKGFCFCCLKF